MRIKFLLFILTLTGFLIHAAETPHKQLLVFRNTGEVTLFYTDSIESISIETIDTIGLCQVFKTHGNTVKAFPVAEIDSVAFGSRNEAEFKSGVRILKDDIDIPYISDFDGEIINYKSDVTLSVLPTVGELLYYGKLTDLFPVGVCARVLSVVRTPDGYNVAIESVDPSEVFSKFFYAGDSSDSEVQQLIKAMSSRAGFEGNLVDISVNTDYFNASVGIDVELKDIVLNIKKHYYHALCIIKPKTELEFNLKLDNTETFDEKYNKKTAHLTPIGGVFVPSFDFETFLTIKASLDFKYQMLRQTAICFEWTRQNGKNDFTGPLVSEAEGDNINRAKMELMLDGTIFAGLEVAARFGLIGDLGGAGVSVKAGPRFKAEIGVGLLQDLSKEYSPELYAKGKVSSSLGVDFQLFVYHKNIKTLFKSDYDIKLLGTGISNDFFEKKLNLFPEFEKPMGISVNAKQIVARAEISEPIEHPLTVGFTLETENIEEPLITEFSEEPLDAGNDEPIGVTCGFNLEEITSTEIVEEIDKYIRPVFKYHEYIVKSAPSIVTDNMFYNYFTHMSTPSTQIIGGAFDVRSKSSKETCVLIGNYFPRIKHNSLFTYTGGSGIAMETSTLKSSISGTWTGNMDGENTTLIFNNDYSGSLNDIQIEYTLNEPQAGDIQLYFTGEEKQKITYTVVELSENKLTLKKKGKSSIYILSRS